MCPACLHHFSSGVGKGTMAFSVILFVEGPIMMYCVRSRRAVWGDRDVTGTLQARGLTQKLYRQSCVKV
jgi:hypothetical protein